MVVIGPISTVFGLITFAVLMGVFQMGEVMFRTGWFIESLITQILMIFAVRTRRSMLDSRAAPLVTGLAIATSILTVCLPFLPNVGVWLGFAGLPAAYFAYLLVVVIGFLVVTEIMKRTFYARIAP
jgi:Mg2+-importing ATPase